MAFVPEERTFTLLNGIVIAAKHWRNSSTHQPRGQRRFLAMHGLFDNATSFDLLAPLLLRQLGPEAVEILSIDLAGHGLSSHRGTEDHSRWRYIDEASQVAEQMGWATHALLGHSMGGGVAVLYAGVFPDRITLCISLDLFGPFTLPIEEQPKRVLRFLNEKRTLKAKQEAFFPSIEAAIQTRVRNGKDSGWISSEEAVAVFIARSLKPVERKDDQGRVLQGYTWRSDRMLTIADVMTNSDLYVKPFMNCITCPLLVILNSNTSKRQSHRVENSKAYLTSCPSWTVHIIEGSHYFHIDDAPNTAQTITRWLQAQDKAEKARL